MAYTGQITADAASIFTLALNTVGKKPHWVPADSLTAAEDQATPQKGFWALYTCIYSSIKNTLDPLVSLFTKFIPAAELRKGFVHLEMGRVLFEAIDWSKYPEVGKPLTYDYFAIPRMFSEHIETDPVHIMAVYNYKEFQHAGYFLEMSEYDKIRNETISYCSRAITTCLRIFLHSILLAGTPSGFLEEGNLQFVWSKSREIDQSYSKEGKKLSDDNSEFKKTLKKAVGVFKKVAKNIVYFNPLASDFADIEHKYPIEAKKPAAIANENDAKTFFQDVYIQKTGAGKNQPHLGINRQNSLYALITLLYSNIVRMTGMEAVSNALSFDPNVTAAPQTEQFFCRADKQWLVVIMNPQDLADARLGVAFTGPHGTVRNLDFSVVESAVGGVFGLPDLLPGQAYILDVKCLNIFPFFEKVFEHSNVQQLVQQFFMHYMFRWAIFGNMCGKKLVATKFHPGIDFYTRFLPQFKAA